MYVPVNNIRVAMIFLIKRDSLNILPPTKAAIKTDNLLTDKTKLIGAIFIAANVKYLYPTVNRETTIINCSCVHSIFFTIVNGFCFLKSKKNVKQIAEKVC